MANKMVESMKFMPAQVLLPVVSVIDAKVDLHCGYNFISLIPCRLAFTREKSQFSFL